MLGQSVSRLEDLPLVRGKGLFSADVRFAHQLSMRIVRSDVAHGLLKKVDTERARAVPGVIAVWTAYDIGNVAPIPLRASEPRGLEVYRQPVLARERVRYVGEAIAVIFAENPYIAEDAEELVTADIEVLPPILDPASEPGEFASGIDSEATIICKEYGAVDAAFANAHSVVALDLSIGRHSGVPLETRGIVARYVASADVLEVYGASDKQHIKRDELAHLLDRPLSSLHLRDGHVGGGFGVRGELYPEEVLACLAALRLGHPIKWVEDRRENLVATTHSREQRHRIRAAASADGKLLALDDVFFHDQGAYVRTQGVRAADLTASMLPGPYYLPAFRIAGHVRLTNKTPSAAYRSPGRYESTFVRERVMDALAAELRLDPVELRRRNLIAASDMPYARPIQSIGHDVLLDSGDYPGMLEKSLLRFGWEETQRELAFRRVAGECVGAGLAFFVEKSGVPASDGVRVTVGGDGTVEVITGAASVGQGMETALAQICAEALGIDYRRIRVVRGQTDRIDFGTGAHASRVTVMSGSATYEAAMAVRELALETAAQLLQAKSEGLTIRDGQVARVEDEGAPIISLAEIARALGPNQKLAMGRIPGLAAERWFHLAHETSPYGVHLAQVHIDRGTGAVKVERYLITYDVGRAVNPMLVKGQLAGGFVQGLGGALFEEFQYGDQGEPLSTTFADYLMPTAMEVPNFDILLTEDSPSPFNPLGIKGAGEGGSNAVGAAIASAVEDALRRSATIVNLPIRPTVLKALLGDVSEKSI